MAAVTTTEAGAFDKHKKQDETGGAQAQQTLPWSTRLVIFLLLPLCVGFIGLYMGYLETKRKPDRELNFDTDFVMPFLLALTLVIVVGFQTGGFTKNKIQPLVKWPQVRRKKVIRTVKRGEEDEDDEVDEKDATDKKDE